MNKQLLAAAVLATITSANIALATDNGDKKEREKCYGIAKAGKNDCAAKDKSNACAGQSKKDADAHIWVYVPVGLCEKLAGGVKG